MEKKALVSEIRDQNGAPALFINGKPDTGLAFAHFDSKNAGPDINLFYNAGVCIFNTNAADLGGCMREDGTFDFSPVARKMDAILAHNPDVLILPRVGLWMPRWWHEMHPEETRILLDLHTGEKIPTGVAFTSEKWKLDMGRVLREYINFCEENYGANTLGYHLCEGDCGEWSYSWKPGISDYGPAQLKAFRCCLAARYDHDLEKLQKAWNQPAVDFESAVIPRDRVRSPGQSCLLDPLTERNVIDYLLFHSEAVADAILHFASITKSTLHELGRSKVCGVFYGYHFLGPDGPHSFHNSGHQAPWKVLSSPDIDFVCVPNNYQERHPGGMYLSQFIAGSARIHGKLLYNEDDTFTFLSRKSPWRYWCPDRETTIRVLRRNFAGTLRDGGTYWWMDHDSQGWYRDEGLMENVKQMNRLAGKYLQKDRRSTAQIAVIVSSGSTAFMRQDETLIDCLLARQTSELASIGASFDIYDTNDLELVFGKPWSRQYRLVVFLDALYLSENERRTIREKVQKDGRTVLWVYGAGYITDSGYSLDAVEELTGFKLNIHAYGTALKVETYITGTRITYGTDKPVYPAFYSEDPFTRELGMLLNPTVPGLIEKQFDDWYSVWSAAPEMSASILRFLARQAGVHIYSEAGDEVFAEHRYLTVHSKYTGEHTIHLPVCCDVRDAITGNFVSRSTDNLQLYMERGETAIWELFNIE